MAHDRTVPQHAALARTLAAPAASASGGEGEALEASSLADLLNSVLDRGVVLNGDAVISVAGVDLVMLQLSVLLSSVSMLRERLGNGEAGMGNRAAQGREVARKSPPASAVPEGNDLGGPTAPAGGGGKEGALGAMLEQVVPGLPEKLDIDPDSVQRDLARLVLTVVELLRRVVEHQAVRRMDDPDLTEDRVERMGVALQQLAERMRDLCGAFGLAADDLNIDLGPLGKLL